MKQHLIDLFKYNDWANGKLLESVKQLKEQEGSVKLYSHLILAQDKWYNRIAKEKEDSSLAWMTPVISLNDLEIMWHESIRVWIELIGSKSEAELYEDVVFNRASDGKRMGIKLMDLALQLNYHSIHHRAQINRLISEQGLTPPSTDYIYTKLKEL